MASSPPSVGRSIAVWKGSVCRGRRSSNATSPSPVDRSVGRRVFRRPSIAPPLTRHVPRNVGRRRRSTVSPLKRSYQTTMSTEISPPNIAITNVVVVHLLLSSQALLAHLLTRELWPRACWAPQLIVYYALPIDRRVRRGLIWFLFLDVFWVYLFFVSCILRNYISCAHWYAICERRGVNAVVSENFPLKWLY